MIGFGFLFQQCRRIAQQILELPLLAKKIEAANPLLIDDRCQTGVLHQPAAFFDDSNAEAVPYLFQLRLAAG